MLHGLNNSIQVRSQSGAISLVVLLIVVVTATTYLLSKLNDGIRFSIYNPKNAIALQETKDALIAWAVNHPINPGTLPMPDRNGDGDYDGDADCFNGTISNNLLLGRVPWRNYPSPCKDSASLGGLSFLARDKSGEQLWYAVSKNLVYKSPDYPYISPGLLSRSTDWITVRDSSGSVISDRVAFVLIAAGPALPGYTNCDGLSYSGQTRITAAPNIGNFLDSVTIGATTYSNADFDQDFIAYTNSGATTGSTTLEKCDSFNDQLVFVTIDELMDMVSKRALNEAAYALGRYHLANGAMPWLVPFADPKSEVPRLTGQASSTSNNLIDTDVDFTQWGVTAGDRVWNLTDGSRGIVTAVAANTLSIGGGLKFGSNNSFLSGDEYFVDVRYIANILKDTATSGSSGSTLVDNGRDFDVLSIIPGDIIDNLSDGSSGIISSVNGDEIIAAELTGGSGNDFVSGDTYRIRTNTSTVTTNTANQTLIDANVDFNEMGVQVGDVVHNLWDQSIARVIAVDSATQLRVDQLKLGSGVVFNSGEPYRISRYIGRNNTRIGLLPMHKRGEVFPSDFSLDWHVPDNGSSVSISTSATDTTYLSAVRSWTASSSGNSGTITIPNADAKCTWVDAEFINCVGIYTDEFEGAATAGSTGLILNDAAGNFVSLGLKRGDLVNNLSEGSSAIIFDVNSATQLTLVDITGCSPCVSMAPADNYEMEMSTTTSSFYADALSTSYATRVYYSDAAGFYYLNESLLQVGDTLENRNGLDSIGVITAINTSSNYVVHTPLQGPGYADVYGNELVRIRHHHVDKRQYDFDVTLKGTVAEVNSAGVRTRSLCSGYDASCTTAGNNATIRGDGSTSLIRVRDYENGTQVSSTTNKPPLAGIASASMRVAGLDFYLDDEYGDLPDWFVRNKWYQYVMVAYSSGESPGGTTCTAGTNCLSLNLRDSGGAITITRNDVRVMVMLARDALSAQSWPAATAADYFDNNSNINLSDEIFDRYPESGTFNDMIRIAVSCPAPNASQLCWSN